MDSQPVPWRSISALSDANIIQIEASPTKPQTKIELTASAQLDAISRNPTASQEELAICGATDPLSNESTQVVTPWLDGRIAWQAKSRTLALPRFEMVNSYALQGTTTVLSRGGWHVQDVVSNAAFRLQEGPEQVRDAEAVEQLMASSDVAFQWQGLWTGQPPNAEIHLLSERSQWNSEGLTQLTMRESSVSANASIRVTGRDMHTNFLELPIAKDWIIDRAEIVDAADESYQMRLIDDGSGKRHMVLRWQQLVPNLSINIEMDAHLPIANSVSSLILEDAKLIQAACGTHSMNYVVRAEGAYALRFTPRLLQMTKPKQELPVWQQDLLPERDLIAFGDYSNGRQLFQFDSLTGTYTANARTLLERTGQDGWQSITHIALNIRSGSVDRIPILLAGQEVGNWSFQLVSQDGTTAELAVDNIRLQSSGDKIECDLLFPKTMVGPFLIRVYSKLHWQVDSTPQAMEIKTPGLPGATESEALILLPERFLISHGEIPIDLLPVGACCESEDKSAYENLWGFRPQKELLAARINGLDCQRLTVVSSPPSTPNATMSTTSPKGTWIWAETLEHRLDDSGVMTHEVRLDVQAQHSGLLTMHVPEDWQLSFVSLHHQATQEYLWQSGKFQVLLSSKDRTPLTIRFSSRQSPLGWLARVMLASPDYDVPVLQRKQSVLVSPKSLLTGSLLGLPVESGDRTQDRPSSTPHASRWQPLQWWQWLNPIRLRSTSITGWTAHDLERLPSSGQTQVVVHVIDQNALATLLWGAMAILSALSWLLLRSSSKAWWLLFCALIGLNLLVTETFLLASQLLLLAMLLGCITRILERIVARPITGNAVRESRGRPGMVVSTMLLSIALSTSAVAQEQSVSGSIPTEEVNAYAVYIPSDADNTPVGEFAYIPKQLRDLLYEVNSDIQSQNAGAILSANYSFKLRQDERDSEATQSCMVDLRILVTQANSEIILPITGSGLTWVGTPMLNGQSRIWGGRNFAVAADEAGVVFRSDTTGVMNLSLQFRPTIVDEGDRRYKISVGIPLVASAKLRVSTGGMIGNLDVNARGMVQRTILGDTLASLGPIDQLNVSWSISPKSSNQVTAEQTSETWVHANGTQLVAACQLTVQYSQALSREVDVFLDGEWTPIGDSWGDAEHISVAPSTQFRGQTVFRVRLLETRGADYRIRMLVIPKPRSPIDRLEVPFLSLDRVNTKARYLWWSADKVAGWLPEVPESRPVRADASSNWAALALAPQRVGYQVFDGGAQLRQQALPASNYPTSELHTLRLRSNVTVLSYESNWEPTGSQPDSLMIDLPKGVSAPELEINGVPARYQLDSSHRLMMISMKENGIGRLGRLKLDMELPAMVGRVSSVPRVGVWQHPASQSRYEIYRSVDLEVTAIEAAKGFEFLPNTTTAIAAEILENLEEKLGTIELHQLPFGDSKIPLVLEIQPAEFFPPQTAVMYVEESVDGWQATLRCQWDSKSRTPDFAFFELPFRVRKSLDAGTLSFKVMPHSNPSRINLCIPIPKEEDSEKTIEFSFQLSEDTSSRSIAMPLIRVFGFEDVLVFGLPKDVDGAPARWLNAGQLLSSSWNELTGVQPVEGYDYYSSPTELTSIAWQPWNEVQRESQAILSWLELSIVEQEAMAGSVQYWLDPRGQITQPFSIPENCQILGVECNGRSAHWAGTESEFQVTLQPNLMPVRIRVMARWDLSNDDSFKIPMAVTDGPIGPVIVTLPGNAHWATTGLRGSRLEDVQDAVAVQWSKMVALAASRLTSLPAVEGTIWLSQWQPELLGLSRDWVISGSAEQQDIQRMDANRSLATTVGELWTETEMLVETLPDQSVAGSNSTLQSKPQETWQLETHELTLQSMRNQILATDSATQSKMPGMILLAIVAFSPWVIGKRLPSLPTHAWSDWLLLATLLWLLIPIRWLSLIFLVVGLWLLILQSIETRRRTRQQFMS